MNLIRHLIRLVLAAGLATLASAQVPQLINYQGRVAVGTVNFEGSGEFKFALVDADGITSYWSNDGTSTAGSEPTAAVALTVTKGLYSVALGDAALANMTLVPATVFTHDDVRLRVWFDDGTHGSQLLTPDQRIAAVGYAMMAADVPDGAITSAKIANGAIGSTQLASGLNLTGTLTGNATTATSATNADNFTGSLLGDVTGTQAATVVAWIGASSAANVHSAELLANAATSLNTAGTLVKRDASGNFTAGNITANGGLTLPANGLVAGLNQLVLANGNVGIGTDNPDARLHVVGSSAVAAILEGHGGSSSDSSQLRFHGQTSGLTWMIGSELNAATGTHPFEIADGISGQTRLTVLPSGKVGIGTIAPEAKLDANGSLKVGAQAWPGGVIGNSTGRAVLTATGGGSNLILMDDTAVQADAGSGGIDFISRRNDTGPSFANYAKIAGARENATQGSTAGYLSFFTAADGGNPLRRMTINSAGNVGIGMTNPAYRLDVNGDVGVGAGNKFTTAAGNDLNLDTPATRSIFLKVGGATKVAMDNQGNVGIGTTTPQSTLEVRRAGGVGFNSSNQFRVSSGTAGNRAEIHFTDTITSDAFISFKPSSVATSRYLSIGAGSNLDNELVVRGDGHVGIGTTTPVTTLDINGTGRITTTQTSGDALQINVDAASGSPGGLDISAGIATIGATAPLMKVRDSAGGNLLRVQADGKVGVGTSVPQSTLHVNGTFTANGTINAVGGLVIENRTSDPATPATGQIWIRTDLP